jgi:hypothetical protein
MGRGILTQAIQRTHYSTPTAVQYVRVNHGGAPRNTYCASHSLRFFEVPQVEQLLQIIHHLPELPALQSA